MIILAIDLGKFNSMWRFYDTVTQKYRFQTVETSRHYLSTVFKTQKIDLVVMEACGPSGWISDLCQDHEFKTLVCSTNDTPWLWKNVKRKTDKDDALKLARMAMLGQLTSVHVPKQQVREHRSLIKYRKKLVGRINGIKNAIRGQFVCHGIEIAKGKTAWFSGREQVNSFRKPLAECSMKEMWQGQLDAELTQLDAMCEQMKNIEHRLDALAKKDERIQRVQAIPGVGPRTAEAIVTTLDDVDRFQNGRQVSAYIGLVPRQYQSGETDRNGRITKRGSRILRTLLVECAWVSVRYNAWAKTTHDRIHGGQKTRKKKAAVALARKIAVVAWAMLRDKTSWDPGKAGITDPPKTEEGLSDSTN